MAILDTINRIFREFKRYTGDGLPGEPTGAALPVGDPQSGPHNPKKSELRAGFYEILGGIDTAIEAANEAAERAEEAAAGAGVTDGDKGGVTVSEGGTLWKPSLFEPKLDGSIGEWGFQDGIYLERSSTLGEAGNGNKFDYHFLKVQDRAAQIAGVNGATGSKVNGFHVFHEFGGSAAHGGRHGGEFTLLQLPDYGPTAAANADRFYVGVQGQVISWTGDGGTGPSDRKGAWFGSSSYAELRDLAFWADSLTGAEINTIIQPLPDGYEDEERVHYHAGLQIASYVGRRGFNFDTGLAISALGGSPMGFRTGILFGSMNGRNPFDSDSTVLAFANSMTLAAGIDLRHGSFSIAPFLAANLSISGAGMVASAPGALIELGSPTTSGAPLIDFHSSGVDLDYDVRLIVEGGGGGVGQGILTVAATAINLSGEMRVSGNKVVGARQGAIGNTDATPANIAATVNLLLAAMRTHGLIAT